jgi:hypothetical protein
MKPVPGLEISLDKVENEDKLRLIPALPDILKSGSVVETRHCLLGEDPNAQEYTTLEATVDLAGKLITVRVMILTTHDGENLYCPMLDEPGPDGDAVNLWIVS